MNAELTAQKAWLGNFLQRKLVQENSSLTIAQLVASLQPRVFSDKKLSRKDLNTFRAQVADTCKELGYEVGLTSFEGQVTTGVSRCTKELKHTRQ